MNPMKYRVSSECSKLIRNILKPNPQDRPSILDILNSSYVLEMSKKFNWDLKKLMKFRKMKNNNLSSSMISGLSYNTHMTSQSDSFYFDKRMSDFSTLIDNKEISSDKKQTITSFNNKSINKKKSSTSSKNFVKNDGMVLNFEKKSLKNFNKIFLKENPKKDNELNTQKNEYIIKTYETNNTPLKNLSPENNKSNLFSNNSVKNTSQVISQNISQNISQIISNLYK